MTAETETLLTLIGALAPERGRFYLRAPTNSLRNERGECPLCAAAHAVNPSEVYYNIQAALAVWRVLGVPAYVATAVMNAADDPLHPLRPALCAALGVEAQR